MGYWLGIVRVRQEGCLHTYGYGREGALEGHLTLDVAANLLYPGLDDGTRTSLAYVDAGGEDGARGDLDRESWTRFLEAALGVLKRLKTDGEPPRTADRIYG
jgi:hypothetical protein